MTLVPPAWQVVLFLVTKRENVKQFVPPAGAGDTFTVDNVGIYGKIN